MAATDTVSGRMVRASEELSTREVAIGLALAAGLLFGLVLLQDPLAHDSLHNFRHTAGIVCH